MAGQRAFSGKDELSASTQDWRGKGKKLWDIDEEVAPFKTHNHIILKLFSTENQKVKPKVSQRNAEFYVILQC